jgi:DNA-binding PadR family transcriptional regulator
MRDPTRVTESLLDVLELLLQAAHEGQELHGWAIMKGSGRSGPTVYGVLDRLEDARWITGRSEERNPEPGRPPRRFYSLTGEGVARAEQLLAIRRRRPNSARPDRIGLAHLMLRTVGLGGAR